MDTPSVTNKAKEETSNNDSTAAALESGTAVALTHKNDEKATTKKSDMKKVAYFSLFR